MVDLVYGYRRYPSPLTIAKPACSRHVVAPPPRCLDGGGQGASQRNHRVISGSNDDGMPELLNR